VAEVLFFQLSSVIEPNIPYVGRYVGRSGREGVVIGRATSVYREICGLEAPAPSILLHLLLSGNRQQLVMLNEVCKFEIVFLVEFGFMVFDICFHISRQRRPEKLALSLHCA